MADDPSKTSILLFSGAWHTITHLQPAAAALEKHGYRVVPRPLPSACGEGTTLEDDISVFTTTIRAELEAGQKVVVAPHSLSGRIALEATSRVLASPPPTGKIVKIIMIASFITEAENMLIAGHLFTQGSIRWGEGEDQAGLLFVENAHHGFFNDMSEVEARPFVEALHPLVAIQGLEQPDPRWKSVPAWYVRCARDNTVLPALQDEIVERHGLREVRMDAGHDPFVSRPGEFAGVVDGIVRG